MERIFPFHPPPNDPSLIGGEKGSSWREASRFPDWMEGKREDDFSEWESSSLWKPLGSEEPCWLEKEGEKRKIPVYWPSIWCHRPRMRERANKVWKTTVKGGCHQVYLQIRKEEDDLLPVYRMNLPFAGHSFVPRQGIRQHVEFSRNSRVSSDFSFPNSRFSRSSKIVFPGHTKQKNFYAQSFHTLLLAYMKIFFKIFYCGKNYSTKNYSGIIGGQSLRAVFFKLCATAH